MQPTKKSGQASYSDPDYYRHVTLAVTESDVTGIVMRDSFYPITGLTNDQHVWLRHPRKCGGPTEYSTDAGLSWQPVPVGQKRK